LERPVRRLVDRPVHVKPRGVAGLINNASELFAHLILSMILKLLVQKYIVRHLTMGAAR
jgi:hypothetical protein